MAKRGSRHPKLAKVVAFAVCAAGSVFAVAVGFSGCMNFRMSETEIRDVFSRQEEPQPRFFRADDEAGKVFVAVSGEGPGVVFVHGSPGSWDNFAHLLASPDLNRRATLAAVDRPGFGNTTPSRSEPSLRVQAKRIHDAAAASGVPMPAIWVGHSLGGPVVTQLALDFPKSVRGLLLVAPSLDPQLEERKWFNWLAKFPLIKWGLSRDWRNSNEEIFPHRRELEMLAERLSQLQVPTIVLHGDRDKLVPVENARFLETQTAEGVVELRILEGVNHFIPWTHEEELVQALEDLLEMPAL